MSYKGGRPRGYKVTEETKMKISEGMKGNTNNKGKHWKCRPRKTQKTLENGC